MRNVEWIKLMPKESVLKLKVDPNFVFCTTNLSRHFNIPLQRVGEILKHYGIDVPKLTKNVRLTTEQWVAKCKESHGDYFDYSKSVYVNGKTLVTIGCPIHGDIQVGPNSHKNGSGCKRCSAKKHTIFKPINKELYFAEVKRVHDNKYDYSKSEDFKTVHDKITIGCPIHGYFLQAAHAHKNGSGCEKCSYIERGKNLAIPFKQFLKLANKKFGNTYKYIEESYLKASGTISYICDIHGEVTQGASTHLISGGCSKCFRKNERSNTNSFIEKAKVKHGNFYLYDKVVYGKSNKDLVTITCPFHGDFQQAPNSHLNGSGCKICAVIKSNIGYGSLTKKDIENSKKIPCIFYVLKLVSGDMVYYKIGLSTQFDRRLKKLKYSHKATIEVLQTFDLSLFSCAEIESRLLHKYRKYNTRGEVPYAIDGSTECLSIKAPIEDIINYIEDNIYEK